MWRRLKSCTMWIKSLQERRIRKTTKVKTMGPFRCKSQQENRCHVRAFWSVCSRVGCIAIPTGMKASDGVWHLTVLLGNSMGACGTRETKLGRVESSYVTSSYVATSYVVVHVGRQNVKLEPRHSVTLPNQISCQHPFQREAPWSGCQYHRFQQGFFGVPSEILACVGGSGVQVGQ